MHGDGGLKDATSRPTSRLLRLLWELSSTVVQAVLIALLLNALVIEAALVESGPSMLPTLRAGERVMLEKVSYRLHVPRRGDIVAAQGPGSSGLLVKRVVALPGETVEVRNGHTIVEGVQLDERWVTYWGGRDLLPLTIPEGHVLILGDNRGNSRDSRVIGPVPVEAIRGRAWFVFWPLDRWRWLG